MQPSVVLASASPQRATLLEGLGVRFEVHPSSYNEFDLPEQDPAERAQRLARIKAEDVAAKYPEAWVIGCDTLVVAPGGTLLEKPEDAADAARMLRLQSGGRTTVHSGLCLLRPPGPHPGTLRLRSGQACAAGDNFHDQKKHTQQHPFAGAAFEGLSSTHVWFRHLTDRDIGWWIGTGLWRDRSGSYQIDGLGQTMIERIDGDWTGVVGLPVFLLGQLAREAGLPLL